MFSPDGSDFHLRASGGPSHSPGKPRQQCPLLPYCRDTSPATPSPQVPVTPREGKEAAGRVGIPDPEGLSLRRRPSRKEVWTLQGSPGKNQGLQGGRCLEEGLLF